MPGVIAAIDQGTTNTKALLVDRHAAPVFSTSHAVTLHTPANGFVEQDARELWLSAQAALRGCVRYAAENNLTIEAIAISNQRETAVAWHRETGEPLAPAVSWQCRRSADICERLRGHAAEILARSGLPLDPLLSASKWAWMLENVPAVLQAAREGALCFGNVDAWLLFQLTGGKLHATDTTNASRTGLLNLATLAWDAELAALFRIPAGALPQICPSAHCFAEATELPDVPIAAVIGDSHAALAGRGHFTPGTVKATYGTGSSLMALTSSLVSDTPALARTVAWTLPATSLAAGTQFALEGNITMSGAAVQWVGEFLGLANPAADAAALAATVADSDGVYFVPAMVGLGAPHWDAHARGVLCNLGRAHTAAHLARAAVEAIAFQVADVFFAIRDAAGTPITALFTDGGATRNDALMQFQADLLDVPIVRSGYEELSAIGAATLAGLTLGWWPSLQAVAALPRPSTRFEPSAYFTDRDVRYAGWQQAVRRARLAEAS